MIGKVLGGRYEILERIGGGGMALVYKARCQLLDRLVAIKILKDEFVNDDEFVRKFKRESQAAASLSHPNIVNIYDVGVEDNGESQIHYIVMEYIKGGTLKDLIVKNGSLSVEKTINISTQIANALQDAHRNKIVHRDIKPQNIMLAEGDRVKVTDFGIARASTSSTVTTTSDVLGSVHYFSPEQARGGYTDEKSDIYSLGIVMYEMVTGVLPYEGESPITVALKHVQEEIVPPREINKSIPQGLENIILKAVEKRQGDRYPNIKEMLNDLNKIKINSREEIFHDSSDRESHTRIIPALNIEDDQKMKKGKKKTKKEGSMKSILLGILAAFIVTAGIFYGSFKVRELLLGGEEIIMIDLVEMQEAEAREKVEKLGLVFEVKNRVKNPDFKAGTVISQDVKEGTPLKKNYPIRVTISEGDDPVQVPDLINKPISDVEDILRDLGLRVNIDYNYSENYPLDHVMEQYPRKLSEVEAGTRVDIVVSQGKEVNNVKMTKLTGMKLIDAKNEILRLGLVVGREDEQASDNIAKGIVSWQSYDQGTELEMGTSVDLIVSSGPSPEVIPEEDEEEPGNGNSNNNDNSNRESTITFTVTPAQDRDETQIKVIRIQDGVSEVVHNKTYNVNEGEITLTQRGKLGSKFEIYYDDVYQTTLINE